MSEQAIATIPKPGTPNRGQGTEKHAAGNTPRGSKRTDTTRALLLWQSVARQVRSALVGLVGVVRMHLLQARRPARRLRVCEAVPLGDKRFVAVVQFERSRFLIGGAPNSLVLLTRLDEDGTTTFSEALAVAERGHA